MREDCLAEAPDTRQIGKTLLLSGLVITAISSSFSISLTEGGILLAWIGLVLRPWKRVHMVRMDRLDYLLLAFLAWEFITALTSPHRSMSIRAYRSEWLVLTFFLIAYGLESAGQLDRIIKLLAMVASVLAIYAVVQHFTGVDYIKHKSLHPWNETYKALGLLGHHITFGVFYAWVFSITASYLMFSAKDLRWRLIWTASVCLCSLAVLYSYSRAAWLGALCSLLTIAALRRFRVTYLVLVLLVVVVVATVSDPSIIHRARTPTSSEAMSQADLTRILLIKTSLRMIAARPILGIGPGTFMAEFEKYKVPGEYRTTSHPHNDFLNFAVRSGIVGAGILALIVATVLRRGILTYRRSQDSRSRCMSLALVAGMIAIIASGLFQCNLTDSEIAVQTWLIAGSIAFLYRLDNGAEDENSALL
jgi:putative inorganic carbon (HCO3(-)) transporter